MPAQTSTTVEGAFLVAAGREIGRAIGAEVDLVAAVCRDSGGVSGAGATEAIAGGGSVGELVLVGADVVGVISADEREPSFDPTALATSANTTSTAKSPPPAMATIHPSVFDVVHGGIGGGPNGGGYP